MAIRFRNIKQVQSKDVEQWLIENIPELTDYQKDCLSNDSIVWFSPYYFYERIEKNKSAVLWRLTLPFFGIAFLSLVLFNPVKWIITGRWGYDQDFLDKWFNSWGNKLDI